MNDGCPFFALRGYGSPAASKARAISSAAPPNSIAITASASMSEARGPTICTPSTLSVRLSARIFTKPSVMAMALARPLGVKGNLPALYSTPFSFSYSSVRPTEAICGEQ